MTYIEFFDRAATENICACLANVPDRVVMIGDKKKLLDQHAERYKGILSDRGYPDVEFVCKSINKNDIDNIVEALTKIIDEYGDCVFDLTGGEDLYLVATGIIKERFKDKNIQMHRFNIRNNTIVDCDNDGRTIIQDALPELTIEENIRVYGGDVAYDDQKPGTTYRWDMSDDFRRDIEFMWNTCKKDVRKWNTQIGILSAAELCRQNEDDPLKTVASISQMNSYLEEFGSSFNLFKDIVERLKVLYLITDYKQEEDTFEIQYKNEQVKRCLTKAGMALEMKIFSVARDVCDTNGNRVYNDVMNGVCIDWDGKIHIEREAYDTENEIDVVMMKGLVPVFVSCKNGYVEIDELYKLNSVSEKFGNQYAKKVLVATALNLETDFGQTFRKRAEAMDIKLVCGIQDMDEQELENAVRNFHIV